ncbi:Predicted ATPase [Sinosporangium album]|uniref:Predicted ATPase n=1 Tax=Sinosporangium album TaxID=504805 RepID=A0A1G8B330_9ACTN|nr:LuxR C-terminal-related transcriptional regulator [Sinosporangium album]SDH27576.1 Predicted ATPase [Sinosporangium album]
MTPDTDLPIEPNAFVGREADIDELAQLMTATRMVTLCGPGGIGKTRLAIRVATRLRDGTRSVRLVDLADAEHVTDPGSRLALALGVDHDGDRPLLSTLIDAIGARDYLLVFDNCETVVDTCARLCQRLLDACPGLRVLATSREPLRVPSETVWRVPPLSLPPDDRPVRAAEAAACEAVRLFRVRAGAAGCEIPLTDDNAADVSRICVALDGMPLAIELAAGMTRVLSVGQIVARLGDRFRLLSQGDRTAPARQRTLRATVEWSYHLLAPEERLLLRRCTALYGGWTIDLAERVCPGDGIGLRDVLPLLTGLVDKSLVVVDGEVDRQARYRLPETIREYAREQLAAAGEEDALLRRHRDAIAAVTGEMRDALRPGRLQPGSVIHAMAGRLAALAPNVVAAVQWSIAMGEAEPALRILTDIRYTLLGTGRIFGDAADLLDAALRLDAPGMPPHLRGQALILRGDLALARGEAVEARRYGEAGLALCREADDAYGESVGCVLRALATGDDAPLDTAAAISRGSGDILVESTVHNARGSLALAHGRLREAQRCYEETLKLLAPLDVRYGMAHGHIGLAQVAGRRGDLAGARRHYESGLDLLQNLNARQQVIRCLSGLGGIALRQGDVAEARHRLTDALVLSRDAGLRPGIARRLELYSTLVAKEGDLPRSVLLAAASVSLRASAGAHSPGLGARLEELLAPARRELGEPLVTRLWTAGSAMTTDQAVDCALEGTRPDKAAAVPSAAAASATPASATPTSAAPASPPASTLTAREREVAGLVVRGLGNKAIADELVISPATAARHMANILGKLGFSSRTQVAAWMLESQRREKP